MKEMRIAVTGGTGVVGSATVLELAARGHSVRIVTPNAARDAARFPNVEPFEADIRDRATLRGAFDGCDAVVHIAAIMSERSPDRTFESVNVDGTRNVVAEAEGMGRFVFVSALASDSAYSRSKQDGESVVRGSSLTWTIVRPSMVYGPGDAAFSPIVKTMRSLHAVGTSDEPLQPIWHEDVARALAEVVERDDLRNRVLEIAGAETTTLADVVARLSKFIDRKAVHVPFARSTAMTVSRNDLIEVLHIHPTPLDAGLRMLIDRLPEQLPHDGVGPLEHKRFFAVIHGSRLDAVTLMTRFRERFAEIIPLEVKSQRIERGNTLTLRLPLRGEVQVRVEIAEPTRILLATIEGHPISGTNQFTTRDRGNAVEFAIDTYTRSANTLDFLAMHTIGKPLQDANWKHVVRKVVELSGGTAKVQARSEKLHGDDAQRVEEEMRAVVDARLRDERMGSDL